MNLRVIQFGKTKEDWLKEAFAEYLKRLRPMMSLDIVELPDTSISKAGTVEKVKSAEATTCLSRISDDDFVVVLDEHGEQKSSLEFSSFLTSLSDKRNVVFVIGGVYGLDGIVLKRANSCFSLSPLTFTHQMARLILLEQIYRALMIISNRKYHY